MIKRKIILIRNAQPYDFGGGERFPVFVAGILKDNHYSPFLISRSSRLLDFASDNNIPHLRGWWWKRQDWNGVRTLLFPIYFAWQVLLFFWYLGVFIYHRPHAVHIQSKDDFIAATFAARFTRSRVIWTDHADLKHVWNNLRIWYKNPIGKLVYLAGLLAHTITVVSQSEYQLVTHHLSESSPLSKKITVIYNGVLDMTPQHTMTKKENSGLVFCVASRLVTDKGIREVIESFMKLSVKRPQDQLVLLGDGPESSTFRDLAKRNKQIVFKGHQKNPLPILANADVFVHPTYHEGFSVALVEASMLGLPIIATSVGGNPEIIYHEKTGILVPPKDTESLHSAMLKLANDAILRQTLGANARKQYEDRFNFDKIVMKEFLPLYLGEKL